MNCEIPYIGLPVYGWTNASFPGTNAVFQPEKVNSDSSWVVWGVEGTPEGGNENAGVRVHVTVENRVIFHLRKYFGDGI